MPVVTLGDVMTREVISIDQEASVQVAAEKMRKENICSLIVQQARNFIGVVTETDVVKKRGCGEEKSFPNKGRHDHDQSDNIHRINSADK